MNVGRELFPPKQNHEKGQLMLGNRCPTGIHYMGGGEMLVKVTRNQGHSPEGPEGLSVDLRN